MITDINGNPYTTATEDMRLRELKNKFQQEIARQVLYAMQTSKDGRLQIHMEPLWALLDQAYYMGREDGGK